MDEEQKKEFIQFLNIAYGSSLEVQSHLYVALDLEYINEADFNSVYEQAQKTSNFTGAFIKYLQSYNEKQTNEKRKTEPTDA